MTGPIRPITIWPRWSAAWSAALNRPRHGEKGAPADRLERYNTVLSMVIGGEYPLAALPAAASIRLAISSPLASLLRER